LTRYSKQLIQVDIKRECFSMTNDEFAQLLAAARHGDIEAMFQLGQAFRLGDQVPQDYEEAITWLRRAAQQGHADAQNDLGSMHLNGLGTAKDAVEATLWYELAAQQGQPEAQFNLALRYLHGDGVSLRAETAVQWLRQAVEHGHIEAAGQLGTLFRFGEGVERNVVSAAELHVIAASEGDVTSMGNLIDYQDEIEDAALSGSVLAALCLAKIHSRGITGLRNKNQTWAWLEWASRHGNRNSDTQLLAELQAWRAFEQMFITADIEQETEALLMQMGQRAQCVGEHQHAGPD
jgi:TPR repeat protein